MGAWWAHRGREVQALTANFVFRVRSALTGDTHMSRCHQLRIANEFDSNQLPHQRTSVSRLSSSARSSRGREVESPRRETHGPHRDGRDLALIRTRRMSALPAPSALAPDAAALCGADKAQAVRYRESMKSSPSHSTFDGCGPPASLKGPQSV